MYFFRDMEGASTVQDLERLLRQKNLSAYYEQIVRGHMYDFEKLWRSKNFNPATIVTGILETLTPILGVKESFRYLQKFVGTRTDFDSKFLLDRAIMEEAKKLPSRNNCLIFLTKNHSELFTRLLQMATKALGAKCTANPNPATLKREAFIDKQRLYQLSESMRSSPLASITRLKFLSNFMSDPQIPKRLMQSFVRPTEEVEAIFEEINLRDCLFTIFYFDQANQKIQNASIKLEYSKIPNDFLGLTLQKFLPNVQAKIAYTYNEGEDLKGGMNLSRASSTSGPANTEFGDKWEFPSMSRNVSEAPSNANQPKGSRKAHHKSNKWGEDITVEIEKGDNKEFPSLELDDPVPSGKKGTTKKGGEQEAKIKNVVESSSKGWGGNPSGSQMKYSSTASFETALKTDFPSFPGVAKVEAKEEEKDIFQRAAERKAKEKMKRTGGFKGAQPLQTNNTTTGGGGGKPAQIHHHGHKNKDRVPEEYFLEEKPTSNRWEEKLNKGDSKMKDIIERAEENDDYPVPLQEEEPPKKKRNNKKKKNFEYEEEPKEEFPSLAETVEVKEESKTIFDRAEEKRAAKKALEWVPSYKQNQPQAPPLEEDDEDEGWGKGKKGKKKGKKRNAVDPSLLGLK